MHALARQTIDAAMAAGATYADARLTHTLTETYTPGGRGAWDGPASVPLVFREGVTFGSPTLIMGIGVRAFVNGYWGFASSPYWTATDAPRLGREAASQSLANAKSGAARDAVLGSVPIVKDGHWIMPGIDPFTVPVDEKIDFLQTMIELVYQSSRHYGAAIAGFDYSLQLKREERVFASSEGASYTQVQYRCKPNTLAPLLEVGYSEPWFERDTTRMGKSGWAVPPLYARGWDLVRNLKLDTDIPRIMEEARREGHSERTPEKAVDVGRYDIVFDASSAGQLLAQTLGVATQLDRALGYEANAGGTSYLGMDPLEFLGTSVAADTVNVTADRTTPGALATTPWDDEGIAGEAFPLVRNGVLVDYQTTREQAAWLAPWYAKRGMSVQSRGCARASTALDTPMQMTPNLTLAPGKASVSIEDMIKDTKRGLLFVAGGADMDHQVKNGVFSSVVKPREIRDGRLREAVSNVGVLFSSLELWKHIVAIGGPGTESTSVAEYAKGQPTQYGDCNITAVPLKVTNLAIIDISRR